MGPDALNLPSLRRVGEGSIREVIVATAPSVEGEATALYIERLLRPLEVGVTRIASGLPMGGELEYADRATLGRALRARTRLGGLSAAEGGALAGVETLVLVSTSRACTGPLRAVASTRINRDADESSHGPL